MARVPGRAIDGIYRPVVRIDLALPDGRIARVAAIVDSGADDSTISAEILARHGIAWGSLEAGLVPRARGVGGTVEQRICRIQCRYEGESFTDEIRVVRELDTFIVGRNDFFRTFRVDFGPWNQNPPAMRIDHR